MAWKATLTAVQEINGTCRISATVFEDPGERSYPYDHTYSNVAQMTLQQVRTDVTNFATEKASAGSAIDDLKTYIGQTFTLEV